MSRVDLVGQPQPHAAHLDRLGVGDLAHHVDIVHAAIDDRRGRLHQLLVRLPGRAAGLLVEVHAEDVGAAELARFRDQPHPGRMVAQDIADHQFPAIGLGRGDDALGIGHRRRQRLFDEDMAARFQRLHRIVGMAVGIGVDRGDVRSSARAAPPRRSGGSRSRASSAGSATSERLTSAAISKPGLL